MYRNAIALSLRDPGGPSAPKSAPQEVGCSVRLDQLARVVSFEYIIQWENVLHCMPVES